MTLNDILLTSEVFDGFTGESAMDPEYKQELELRKDNPALKEAWEKLGDAQDKFHTASDRYNVLLKLVQVTEKF